jgi:hypothetical protein
MPRCATSSSITVPTGQPPPSRAQLRAMATSGLLPTMARSSIGTITASNVHGSGGTVDTLANTLTLAGDAATQAGVWNVSTPNFTVNTAAAGAFTRSMNEGSSVDVIATGTDGTSGDLNAASSLIWQGPGSLSLVAFHNVTPCADRAWRSNVSTNSVASFPTIEDSAAVNLALAT